MTWCVGRSGAVVHIHWAHTATSRLAQQWKTFKLWRILSLTALAEYDLYTLLTYRLPLVSLLLCLHLTYTHATVLRPLVQDQAGGPVPEETFTHSHPSWSSDILYQLPPSATIHSILFIATESVNQLPFAPLVIICILNICICWYIGTCLRCFDTVGWVLGRASGL